MKQINDDKLLLRAAKLLAERKVLRSKIAAARRAVRAKTNAEIIKFVRNKIGKSGGSPADIYAGLVKILEVETDTLGKIRPPKTPKKEK